MDFTHVQLSVAFTFDTCSFKEKIVLLCILYAKASLLGVVTILSYLVCSCRRHFWHATQDCVDHILHKDRFWAISIASDSVKLWDLRSCCMVLSHVMWGVLVVSSSLLEGELTGSSWHLRYRPYAQYAQKGSGDVICLSLIQ